MFWKRFTVCSFPSGGLVSRPVRCFHYLYEQSALAYPKVVFTVQGNADALIRKVNRGRCRNRREAIALNGDRQPPFTLVEGHQSIMALPIRRVKPNPAGKDQNRSGRTLAAPVTMEGTSMKKIRDLTCSRQARTG